MIARLCSSWRMIGHSIAILRHHPHFMLFPILSAIALMVILSLRKANEPAEATGSPRSRSATIFA